ncbi:hypothetical protein H4Q32_027696 [Labeo rohita]|uniref:FIIND domain-containing protein n=1 Tax=Labeo rohita TaxID=84645 RepID=A0ABQ8L1S2_LABRO|nr:hypothetical protein H4Q32_027696 [Labeo rohita]
MNAEKVERNIIETQQNLNRDIRKINEGKQPLYQKDITRTILDSLELLNALGEDAAEASRLQHPHSDMIEKDVKQLRERVMKLCEEYERNYNCSITDYQGKKTDEKLGDSEWELQRPLEVKTDADIKYSVSSSAGQHECSETSLRWESASDVSLEYRFVEWKSLSKDILKNYKPCGPLIDISVTNGTLREVQLPHFVCVDSVSSSDDAVKVLHVKDGTVSFERCELSGSHAKILNPTFSCVAIVVEAQRYNNMKFQCETLIYRNRKASLNLHVYLIVKDQKLKKDVEEKEIKNMEILKPIPDEALIMDDSYILKTSCDSKIKPSSLKLTPGKANFFDIHLQDVKECLELSIETKEGQKIWDVNIESDEFNRKSSACAEFVDKHRTQLIRKVSLVEPIADDMKDLIGDEKYGMISMSVTKEEKMRTLLNFLTTPKLKDKLYQSLVEHEYHVIEYLNDSG